MYTSKNFGKRIEGYIVDYYAHPSVRYVSVCKTALFNMFLGASALTFVDPAAAMVHNRCLSGASPKVA